MAAWNQTNTKWQIYLMIILQTLVKIETYFTKSHHDYLKDTNPNIFVLKPVTPDETALS